MSFPKKFFYNASAVTFIATVILFIVISLLNPDFDIKRFDNKLSVILRILAATGITATVQRFVKKSRMLRSLLYVFVSIVVWLSFFPVYSIRFAVVPKDAVVYLNGKPKINPVRGLCPGNYDVCFRKNGYADGPLELSFMDVIFRRTIEFHLNPLRGALLIQSNAGRPLVVLRDCESGKEKEFGKTSSIDSIQYGEYWMILRADGYDADSALVQINSGNKTVTLDLKKRQAVHCPVRILTNAGASVYLVADGRLLGSANEYGVVEFYLPEGIHAIRLAYGQASVQKTISIQRNQPNGFNFPF